MFKNGMCMSCSHQLPLCPHETSRWSDVEKQHYSLYLSLPLNFVNATDTVVQNISLPQTTSQDYFFIIFVSKDEIWHKHNAIYKMCNWRRRRSTFYSIHHNSWLNGKMRMHSLTLHCNPFSLNLEEFLFETNHTDFL